MSLSCAETKSCAGVEVLVVENGGLQTSKGSEVKDEA